jgi:gluconate 2-dehydrogenase gamma chain
MNGPRNPERRKFLGIAATAAACGAVTSCVRISGDWWFFKPDEAATVNAICERIIPADEDAGAAAAGVVNFIDQQMRGPFQRFRKTYRQGIIAVNHISVRQFKKPFAELAPEQQDQVLIAMDESTIPPDVWDPAQAALFFDMVINHAMQGFYGDPRHGGNREAVSWRMLGVPVVPIRGRQLYDLTGGEL